MFAILGFFLYFRDINAFIPNKSSQQISYIPIGDSYTIGQGVARSESWPEILTTHLRKNGIEIELTSNPSVSGYTTQNAINLELPIFKSNKPTFTTVLIGANDSFQKINPQIFENRLKTLLDEIQKTLPDKNKIILITIPDYSSSPAAIELENTSSTKMLIINYNNIIKKEAEKRNIPVVDLFPLTEKLKGKPEFFVSDGLHPSARQYQLWEELIYPVAYEMLKDDNN